MRKKLIVMVFGILGFAFLFVSTGINAGTTVPDVIKMDTKGYSKHTKGIVVFNHKKHSTEYKATCGDCHHDANHKPLNLKEGDHVQQCIECHKKPGKAKGKMSKKQKLEYHAEAMHQNCIGCHKKYDKKNKTKAAPTTCAKCHPKK